MKRSLQSHWTPSGTAQVSVQSIGFGMPVPAAPALEPAVLDGAPVPAVIGASIPALPAPPPAAAAAVPALPLVTGILIIPPPPAALVATTVEPELPAVAPAVEPAIPVPLAPAWDTPRSPEGASESPHAPLSDVANAQNDNRAIQVGVQRIGIGLSVGAAFAFGSSDSSARQICAHLGAVS
jgi:hypothetical protein